MNKIHYDKRQKAKTELTVNQILFTTGARTEGSVKRIDLGARRSLCTVCDVGLDLDPKRSKSKSEKCSDCRKEAKKPVNKIHHDKRQKAKTDLTVNKNLFITGAWAEGGVKKKKRHYLGDRRAFCKVCDVGFHLDPKRSKSKSGKCPDCRKK